MNVNETARNRCYSMIFHSTRRFSLLVCSLALLLILQFGCARLELTPITQSPSGIHNQGQVLWHDLITDDIQAARSFYGDLLGWTFEENGQYTVVLNRDVPIGGMVEIQDELKEQKSGGWITYFSIPDIDGTAKWVLSVGGDILQGPGNMVNRGRYATILDPLGAPLVLLNSQNGDPERSDPPIGNWLWNELWTTDIETALQFYQELGGYAAQRVGSEDMSPYWLLIDANNHYQGGITEIPFEKLPAQWVPVVRVADIMAITPRVTQLGGKVIVNTDHPLSDGSVALIKDPTGGIFMVESWNPENKTAGSQQ